MASKGSIQCNICAYIHVTTVAFWDARPLQWKGGAAVSLDINLQCFVTTWKTYLEENYLHIPPFLNTHTTHTHTRTRTHTHTHKSLSQNVINSYNSFDVPMHLTDCTGKTSRTKSNFCDSLLHFSKLNLER